MTNLYGYGDQKISNVHMKGFRNSFQDSEFYYNVEIVKVLTLKYGFVNCHKSDTNFQDHVKVKGSTHFSDPTVNSQLLRPPTT